VLPLNTNTVMLYSFLQSLPTETTQNIALVAVFLTVISLYLLLKLRESTKIPADNLTDLSSRSGDSPPRLQRHDSIADVVELVVYPIKSCAGISLDRVALTRTGFRGDRMWMVVEPQKSNNLTDTVGTSSLKYQFLTQRQCPRLALIQPKIQSSNTFQLGETPRHSTGLLHGMKSITLSAPSCSDIICPIVRALHHHAVTCDVSMWEPGTVDDANGVVDQGDEVAEWLSSFLDRPNLRLVFRDITCTRIVNNKYHAPGNQPSNVSFADGMQYLIASRTSLADLNRRIDTAHQRQGIDDAPILTMDRFRPNIVVNRSPAFDEDTWSEIQIGTPHAGTNRGGHEARVTFHGVKHCTRCVIPTTDQNTGEQGGAFSEPLTTLRTFRRQNNDKGKPLFGENLAHREDEWDAIAPFVSVGDEVYLVERKHPGVIGGSARKGGSNGCRIM
jgi:uncharacterized protein